MRRLVLPLVLALALSGCQTQKTELPTSANQTLRALRAALDAVRPSSHPSRPPSIDVSPLVGLTRSQIRSSLGTPHVCNYPKPPAPNEVMGAPCEHNGDWFYSFYELPRGWIGGGPELLLSFGADEVCTTAKWMMTQ